MSYVPGFVWIYAYVFDFYLFSFLPHMNRTIIFYALQNLQGEEISFKIKIYKALFYTYFFYTFYFSNFFFYEVCNLACILAKSFCNSKGNCAGDIAIAFREINCALYFL